MTYPESCLTCGTLASCDCKSALLAFYRLLDTANQRVLRSVASSSGAPISSFSAGIDKINGYFTETISVEQVYSNSKLSGSSIKRVFLKDRKPYLEVSNGKGAIHFRIGADSHQILSFVSNPNKFGNWGDYISLFSSICPLPALKLATVSRIDLNLDFKCEFPSFLEMIDIKGKRNSLSYTDESGDRTGLIIGKGTEVIAIYNKSKKDNLKEPTSRVEIRLSGTKLPTRAIMEIPKIVSTQTYFKNIECLHIHNTDFLITKEQEEKLKEFRTISRREGFFAAKKLLSKNRNFDRDFGQLAKFESWQSQPSTLFKTKIKDFFN